MEATYEQRNGDVAHVAHVTGRHGGCKLLEARHGEKCQARDGSVVMMCVADGGGRPGCLEKRSAAKWLDGEGGSQMTMAFKGAGADEPLPGN